MTFTLVVDDPAGNSYVESLTAPLPDPKIRIEKYKRSPEQNDAIGLQPEHVENNYGEQEEEEEQAPDVMIFGGVCSRCSAPCPTNMSIIGEWHYRIC
jgi:zinc finger protein